MFLIALERQDCTLAYSSIDGQEGDLERVFVAEECLDEVHNFMLAQSFVLCKMI